MIYFFIATTFLSFTWFAADFFLRYTAKLRNFGSEKLLFDSPWWRKRFAKYEPVPFRKFLPENLTMIIIFLFAMSQFGFYLSYAGNPWFVTVPAALCGGCLVIFFIQYVFLGIVYPAFTKKTPPKGDAMAGINGYVSQEIGREDYGKIIFEWKDREFEMNAYAVDGKEIAMFEKVLVVYAENDCCYVESILDVYDVLNNAGNYSDYPEEEEAR